MTHNVVKIILVTFVALWERKMSTSRSFKIAADVENERGEMMTRRTEGHFDKTYS